MQSLDLKGLWYLRICPGTSDQSATKGRGSLLFFTILLIHPSDFIILVRGHTCRANRCVKFSKISQIFGREAEDFGDIFASRENGG